MLPHICICTSVRGRSKRPLCSRGCPVTPLLPYVTSCCIAPLLRSIGTYDEKKHLLNYQQEPLPDFIVVSERTRKHITERHASEAAHRAPIGGPAAAACSRGSSGTGALVAAAVAAAASDEVAKATFLHEALLKPCIAVTLTTPTKWAFHRKRGASNMIRLTAFKKFDSKIGHLGLTGACTKWVRVVVDVCTELSRFHVATAYPSYAYSSEFAKRDTYTFARSSAEATCFLSLVLNQIEIQGLK